MTAPALKLANPQPAQILSRQILQTAGELILDKDLELKLAFCCLLSRGHLLIEDIPGMGKTTFVKVLAQLLGLKFSRIQFTSDLLPGDILGSSIYDETERRFRFHPGPIFAELVLGDELNRATPRTQSAFMQALEEYRITIDGTTHELPSPFFFIATQNPRSQVGTFPLPESQLDRFLMRIRLGYPSRESEARILKEESRESLIQKTAPMLTGNQLLELQTTVSQVTLSEPIVQYMQDLLDATRTRQKLTGLSTRAGLHMAHAAKSWAFLEGRNFVIPEDVKAIAPSVMNHRISSDTREFERAIGFAQEILDSTPIR